MRTGGMMSRWVIGVVIAAALAGAVLAAADVQTPARVPLALLFLLAAPGLAVAALLGGIDALGKVVIAGSAALVIDMAIAESMIATRTWSPRLGIALIALVSVVIAAARPLIARWPAHQPASSAGTARSGGRRPSRR
jgi:hypothetical protein